MNLRARQSVLRLHGLRPRQAAMLRQRGQRFLRAAGGQLHPRQPKRAFRLPATVRRAIHQLLELALRQRIQTILPSGPPHHQQFARFFNGQLGGG